jgi:hypothetical protein
MHRYCHVYGVGVTSNEFWIRWLDLLALLYSYNQLWQLTVSDCLPLAPHLAVPRATSSPVWRMTNEEFLLTLWIALIDVCLTKESWSRVESYVTTDGQSANVSWNEAPIWGLRSDFCYCQTVAGLLMWGTLSDERTGLSFTIIAGPRQRSHSRVRVLWDSRPSFTVSDSRLPFSSPPTTYRTTVEVFDPASTLDESLESLHGFLYRQARIHGNSYKMIRCHENVFSGSYRSNGYTHYITPSWRLFVCIEIHVDDSWSGEWLCCSGNKCLPSRYLAMDVCSVSSIPAFSRYVTVWVR